MATILAAFVHFPKEAQIIGRLLAGYGELEVDLMLCVGDIIDNREVALKVLFRTRGESQRIEVADALARPRMAPGKLRTQFEEAVAGMKFCVQIRNQYAHCNWHSEPDDCLRFTNMEDVAKGDKSWSDMALKQHRAQIPLLEAQEAYFIYIAECLQCVRGAAELLAGRKPTHLYAAPPKMSRPPLRS